MMGMSLRVGCLYVIVILDFCKLSSLTLTQQHGNPKAASQRLLSFNKQPMGFHVFGEGNGRRGGVRGSGLYGCAL